MRKTLAMAAAIPMASFPSVQSRLGEAVVAQQGDVIAAVETFRDRAYAAGNLETDDYQEVVADDGVISIEPVDDEIIYVPFYENLTLAKIGAFAMEQPNIMEYMPD